MEENTSLTTSTDKFELVTQEAEMYATELLACTDASEFSKVINNLNTSLRKKELLRTNLFSQIQDLVGKQLLDRVLYHADEFSNKDLLQLMTSLQSAINTSLSIGKEEQKPVVAIQQNTFVSSDSSFPSLDRSGRERVKDMVDAILNQANNPSSDFIDGNYKEFKNTEEEN